MFPGSFRVLRLKSFEFKSLISDVISSQDLAICNAEGRDCIQENFSKTFHCNTNCVGVYADVQWVAKDVEQEYKDDKVDEDIRDVLVREIDEELLKVFLLFKTEIMKHTNDNVNHKINIATGQRGEELDSMKYKMLISEYRKFKTKTVKHFRFNSAANLSNFG